MSSNHNLKPAVEALLITAESPLSLVIIAGALEEPLTVVTNTLLELQSEYENAGEGEGRGFELRQVGGGWRLFVNPKHDWAIKRLIAEQSPAKLSQAALETLAVIAYKQPISRGQVSSIRGVSVDGVVRTLLSRGLITELFTDADSGAVMFGTSEQLLSHLGINSLAELPAISPFLPGQEGAADGN
jgi:segregation and condensation protein B